MNVFDCINNRRSYRGKYSDTTVPRDDLRKILEAGLAAPSGCNKQTTALIAVDDPETVSRIKSVIDPP
ncbi:MAG: nitroreductase family protein, partial [Clostridia bacterium]|nr:nitroreductase family protein [Clostridia bacterium]